MYGLYSSQNLVGGGTIAPSALRTPITMAIREGLQETWYPRLWMSHTLQTLHVDSPKRNCGEKQLKEHCITMQPDLYPWFLKSSSLSYYIIPCHFYVDICLQILQNHIFWKIVNKSSNNEWNKGDPDSISKLILNKIANRHVCWCLYLESHRYYCHLAITKWNCEKI